MPDKQLGRPVAEDGNYGLSQAEADKARAWAKEREPVSLPPGPGPLRDAEWRTCLDKKYPHGFRGGQGVTAAPKSVTPSVTAPPSVTSGNAPGETTAERKKRLTRERVTSYRARKKD